MIYGVDKKLKETEIKLITHCVSFRVIRSNCRYFFIEFSFLLRAVCRYPAIKIWLVFFGKKAFYQDFKIWSSCCSPSFTLQRTPVLVENHHNVFCLKHRKSPPRFDPSYSVNCVDRSGYFRNCWWCTWFRPEALRRLCYGINQTARALCYTFIFE